ncbi:hypothetical protein [Streptomyces sp. cg2]|uniref:hypothetical protein n=1 Tax=Streptomyces sp. cg2 TaxID=3238799 RepID=UPI0034E2AF83
MLKKLRDTRNEKQRHRRLLNAALDQVRQAEMDLRREPKQVTANDVATLAFGRYSLRPTESEASDYLAAALIMRGHSIAHLPTPTDTPAIPAQREGAGQ